MKIRNIKYIVVIGLVLMCYSSKAQKKETVKVGPYTVLKGLPNLSIGDQVPDFKIPKLINYPKRSLMMSEFKDRLVIFDFWYRSCSGCIEALPRMEAMQKQFGDKIQVIPVNYESELDVAPFWKNNKSTRNLKLIPSVVEDSVLHGYFQHLTAPHEVWVYKGKVVGITQGDYVNAENIGDVLNGKQINWPVKDDFYHFDGTKEPLFSPDPSQLDTAHTFLKYAAISDYRTKVQSFYTVPSAIVRDKKKKTVRSFILNMGILSLYQLSWAKAIGLEPEGLINPTKSTKLQPNSVLWEVADRSKYIWEEQYGSRSLWLVKNGVGFESLNPDTGQTDQDIELATVKDLDRLLGLHVRWEKRKEKVLVLVRTTKEDKLKGKPLKEDQFGNAPDRFIQNGASVKVRDSSLPIADKMNRETNNPYVFDETGYEGKVDMDLNIPSWTDIPAIRKAIAPYGLTLKEEERQVDKLVFTEINGGLLVDGQMQEEAKAKREAQAGMKDPTDAEAKAFMEANKKNPGIVTLPSGLQYKIIKKGTGAKPALTDKVSVHFIGTLVNGKIFDSSKESGMAFSTGLQDVIQGWKEALPLMPAGSKWMIYVPAELAYGSYTGQGSFPPNSPLVFDLELLSIVKQ